MDEQQGNPKSKSLSGTAAAMLAALIGAIAFNFKYNGPWWVSVVLLAAVVAVVSQT